MYSMVNDKLGKRSECGFIKFFGGIENFGAILTSKVKFGRPSFSWNEVNDELEVSKMSRGGLPDVEPGCV